ncbi:hypothetical protein ABGT15_09590 [Flavobacterium enshiense]|uniref:hypothetical protein n=1 Tax=Flavobacterium enshiense TaxID=1341165 RepID=UPI00345C8FCA
MKYLVKTLFCVLVLAVMSSCEKVQNAKSLRVEIDLVIQESDSLQVFYSNNASVAFTEKHSFWHKVQGMPKNQNIEIVFPDSILPKQFRIDFGRNIKQTAIVLNKIQIDYHKETIPIKGNEIFKMFRVDETNTSVDKLNGLIKRKDTTNPNGPSLYPNGNKLYDCLNKLYTQK